ncbi:MAG TPA: response regulator [Vicinamibacterales bacterium]|nr:response regulator [Vicinamibacterales bacterium]
MTPLEAVLDRPAAQPLTRLRGTMPFHVLVADDQPGVIDAIRLLLGAGEFAVVPAASPGEAVSAARSQPLDAALIDLNYDKGRTTGEQGLDLLAALLNADPSLPVVVMTAWGSIDLALEAVRRGARDFVEKPWEESRLVAIMRAQAELGRALKRVAQLETEVQRMNGGPHAAPGNGSLGDMRLLEVEGLLVRRAMEKFQGNVSRAARALGLSRSALYRRLERHKI